MRRCAICKKLPNEVTSNRNFATKATVEKRPASPTFRTFLPYFEVTSIPFFDRVRLSNRFAQFSVSFYSLEMSPSLDRTCQESFHKHPILRKLFPRHQNKPVWNRRSFLVRISFIYSFDSFQSFELVDYLFIPICLNIVTMFGLQY